MTGRELQGRGVTIRQFHSSEGDPGRQTILTFSFTHHEHIALDVDDYCDFEGERYWLCEAYRPVQKIYLEWGV